MKLVILEVLPVLFLALLAACTSVSPAVPAIIPVTPVPDASNAYFQSAGGGEPRSASYWLIWNSCALDNQSSVAASNGGREAGWVILDDLLQDPGLTLGDLAIESCQQAVSLLNLLDLDGQDRSTDSAYQLARALLVAQLNLFAGAESCPAVDQAVLAGHLLLSGLAFDAHGDYLGGSPAGKEYETAQVLVDQLDSYNLGELCR